MLKRIKTINSYRAHAQFLAELAQDEPMAYLARVQVEEIPSPYASSPTVGIYSLEGRAIIWFETRHKHYEVFEVPANMLRFDTDEKATDWHIRFSRRSA